MPVDPHMSPPVIATVAGMDERSARDVFEPFESVARRGGVMAGFDRVAYFPRPIPPEIAEPLAQLGVALKFFDPAVFDPAGPSLIPALLDEDEQGFLIAIRAGFVVRRDLSEWVGLESGAAIPHARPTWDRRSSDGQSPPLSLYDDRAILLPREMARIVGSAWRERAPAALGAVSTMEGVDAETLGLSLAVFRLAALPARLPAGVVERAVVTEPRRERPMVETLPGAHMTPHFDNREFWNHRYQHDPQRGSGIGSRGAPRALKESLIRREVDGLGSPSILDVGCGDLASVESLPISQYVGIDISDEVIATNRFRRPNWTFRCGDFVRLCETRAFASELVLCFDVLIHQHEFVTYEAFVRQLVLSCRGVGLVGAFQAPPRAPYRSEITAYHEPITVTLARMGATEIEIVASYRDTVVAQFRQA